MKRFLAISTIALGILSACASPSPVVSNSTGSTSNAAAYSDFGANLSLVQNRYITPIDLRELLVLALLGVEHQSSPAADAVQPIIQSAIAREQATPPLYFRSDSNSRNLMVQLTIFAEAIRSVRALPDAPTTPMLLQAATAGMLDHLDQNSIYIPATSAQLQPIVGFKSAPNQSVIQGIELLPKNCAKCICTTQPPIFGTLIDQFIYLRVTAIQSQTPSEIKTLYLQLENRMNGKARGLILDLRFNSGGLLIPATETAGLFLPTGAPIAEIQDRRPQLNENLFNNLADITHGLPIVALINGQTAVGGEMIAGSLQYNQRAILFGTSTSGSGYVLTFLPLQGFGQVLLRTGQIILPSGNPLQFGGINPDVDFQLSDAATAGVFGPPPFGEPINDHNVDTDLEVKQAKEVLELQ